MQDDVGKSQSSDGPRHLMVDYQGVELILEDGPTHRLPNQVSVAHRKVDERTTLVAPAMGRTLIPADE